MGPPDRAAPPGGSGSIAPLECTLREVACSAISIPAWTDHAGWSDASRADSIALADLDSDDVPELLGRSSLGVEVWTFQAAGDCAIDGTDCGQWVPFTPSLIDAFSDANGSDVPAGSAIRVGDLAGDGQAEIFGWTPQGIAVFRFLDAPAPVFVPDLVAGLEVSAHPSQYSTLMATDVDGNGRAEVAARTSKGFEFFERNDQGDWIALPILTDARDGTSWSRNEWEWSTFTAIDLTGGPGQEIIGHGAGATVAWHLDTTTMSWTALPELPDAALPPTSWTAPEVYASFQAIDRNGDGREEILVPGSQHVYVIGFSGSDPGAWHHEVIAETSTLLPPLTVPYARNGGVQVAALDGVGGEEIVVHTPDGLVGYGVEGSTGQPTRTVFGPAFSARNRFRPANAGVGFWPADGSGPVATLIGRSRGGIQTAVNVQPGSDPPTYELPSANYPVFEAEALAAYDSLSTQLAGNLEGGIRSAYADTSSDLQGYLNQAVTRPSNVPAGVWTSVTEQIDRELNAAMRVSSHYEHLATLYTEAFAASSERANAIATQLQIDSKQIVESKPEEILRTVLELASKALDLVPKVGGILSGLATGVDMAMQYFDPLPSNGDFQVAISDMDDRFHDHFSDVLTDMGRQHAHIVSDHGLMTTVAARIRDESWAFPPDTQNRFRYGLSKGADLGFFQALIPVGFEVWYCRTGDEEHFTIACQKGNGSKPPVISKAPAAPGDSEMWLAHRFAKDIFGGVAANGLGIPESLAETLFGSSTFDCDQTWTSDCNFALDPAEVYRGAPGWDSLPCASSRTGNFVFDIHWYRYHRPCDRVPPQSEWFDTAPPIAEDAPERGKPWITITIDGVTRILAEARSGPAADLLNFHLKDPARFDLAETLPNGRIKRRFDDDEIVKITPNSRYVTIDTGP